MKGAWSDRAGARRGLRRTVVVAAVLFAVVGLLAVASPRMRTALRWVDGFSPLAADGRVFHEAGAGQLAEAIAAALPDALSRVEELQAAPFVRPFRVYVCASHESFTRRIGQSVDSPVRGIAFPRDVWISPRAFDFHGRDTHRESLLHELSHLHLQQHLSWWRRTGGVPAWFHEGLADWVADTGFEQLSPADVRTALAAGHALAPDDSGRMLYPRRPQEYGLSWPMFHAQSRMFVEYLRSRDTPAFTALVADVVAGTPFAAAFRERFGSGLDEAWAAFEAAVEAASRESPAG